MMKKHLILVLGVLILIAVFVTIDESDAAPDPKRRKSGSSRSSSGSSSWFGGSKNKNKGYGNSGYGGNGGYKKKNKMKSNLKKAAVIGATAYGAYQLGKLSGRFSGYGGGYGYGGHRYGYNEWNRWREIDGFLCRRNEDCNWIDPRLYCQDYELKFTPTAAWFGGDVASIVGECACPRGMVWNDYQVQCETNYFSGTNLLLFILIPILALSCCCCAGIFLFKKMRG